MGTFKQGRPHEYDPQTGDGTRPPSGSNGLYYIREYETGRVDYVGEGNINHRTNAHIRSGKLTPNHYISYKVADSRSTSGTRRYAEKIKIKEHSPSLNKSKGGEGRSSSR